jgi:hypothetical protein
VLARRRVHDHAPADSVRWGELAEHHPVALGCHERCLEPQLRVPRGAGSQLVALERRHARRGLARPVVHVHPRPAAQRAGRRLQARPNVEQVARPQPAIRRRDHVSPPDLAPAHAREVQRDALAGVRHRDGRVVHLDGPHPRRQPAREHGDLVARSQLTRPQGPGDNRADPAQRERAVDVEPHAIVRPRPARKLGGHGVQRRRQVVKPGARQRRHRHDRSARRELGCLLRGELGLAHVGLRDRDHPRTHAELPQHGHVLARLRHHAVVGGHAEQEQVHPRRARDHRADEPLVPRHVDHGQPPAARQVERRVAELDRYPARPLLRQPIRVLPGEHIDQGGLAVIDVPSRAQGERRPFVASSGHLRAGD